MRLINVEVLLKKLEWLEEYDYVVFNDVKRTIDEMPTVDAIPVRHGRWIYKGVRGRFPVCECSVCGNVENADWAVLGDNVNYCPNCGAKMDGGEKWVTKVR